MTRFPLLLAICFAGVSLYAAPRAEHALRDRLAAEGVACGFDADRNVLVVIGTAVAEVRDPKTHLAFATVRETLFRIAGLKARATVLQMVRQEATGLNGLRVAQTEGRALKDAESVFKVFAEGSCRGLQPIVAEESFDAGVYSVAIAVRWQLTRTCATPAEDAERELRSWCAKSDLAKAMPTASFCDSAGYVHPLGIAFGDWDEAADGLCHEALMAQVAAMARKNLLLAVFGDAVVRKAALARLSSAGGCSGSAEQAFEALATEGVAESGMSGLSSFCERIVVSPITGRRQLVVVYAALPAMSATVRAREAPQATSVGRPLVFNPATGRFEQVTTGGK